MSRTKGYKCFNIKCGSCIGKTLCGEPEDTALVCVDRVIGKPMTNAQKIRAMTDEELVNFLMRLMGHAQCFAEGIFPYHPCPQEQNCKQCGIDWLQQPAEEDDHDERKENENV